MKGRRVGTFTLGITLVVIGILYLVYAFMPGGLDLLFMLRFWPVVLISLGCEVLLCYFFNKEEKLRYDGAAIFLSICVVGMAWCMALAEMVLRLENGSWYNGYWHF